MTKAQVIREADKQGIQFSIEDEGIVFIGDGVEMPFIKSYGIPMSVVWTDAMDWLKTQ